VIGVGVRQHDGGGRKGTEPAEPIRPAIDHDAGIFVPNEHCTVTPVPAGPDLNLTARTDKRQLHRRPWL